MPRIEFHDLPFEIERHFLRKVRKRALTDEDVRVLIEWLVTEPEGPEGEWYRRFDRFILCGEGPYPKTVLEPEMNPYGIELD